MSRGVPVSYASSMLMRIYRGRHPFDYEETNDQDDQSFSLQFSQDRLSLFSQGSIVSEQVVKSRIINGYIDFTDDIWNELPDGRFLFAE